MTTSGSANYSVTFNDIAQEAMEHLGVLGAGETITASDAASLRRTLNMMVKYWQAEGMNRWTRQDAVLFFASAQESYSLVSTTSDHVCLLSDLTTTALAADAATGADTITADDDDGIADGDYIGILTATSAHWTTVNGAPADNVITIDDVLTEDFDTDTIVVSYTSKLERPVSIVHARLRDSSDNETPILVLENREEYFDLPAKSTTGRANQVYYEPGSGTGTIYIWPVESDLRNQLRFTVHRSLYDFDSNTNNPDFPQEWYWALATNLAVLVANKFGVAPSPDLKEQAILSKAALFGFDSDGSFVFQPEFGR